ncbi:MAG: hypothetical protein JWP39_480, partial [Jatrophihabitans sp.]|nr:hypothetical protein [Jatrophihabitans sp.]
NTVTAELTFNEDHDLVDFVSDDRLRASVDAKSFIRQRWSTPVHNYQQIGPRRLAAVAEARWHASEPEGEFAYVDLHIDHVDYNLAGPATGTTTADATTAPAVTAPKS